MPRSRLVSHRAPERGRKGGKRIARPAVLDPRVKYDREARQSGEPKPGADIDGTEWQHAPRQRGDAEAGHNGSRDRRDAAAGENLCPGYTGFIEKLPGDNAHAAGLRHRGNRQGLTRAMLPAWRRVPAEVFFGQDFPVAPAGMQTDDHRIEFPPVEALQQVDRGSNPDFDQQLGVLRVHAGDQRRELRPRNMVADADGEALPGAGKCAERAIVRLQQFTGVLEEDGAPRRKLHVPRRPFDEPTAEPLLQPLQFQAYGGLRGLRGFSRTGEAAELGNADEGLDGVQIEGSFSHLRTRSLISLSIVYQNNTAACNAKRRTELKGPAMPLSHISLRAGKPEAYRQAIFDSLYRALRETLDVPEDDQFMTITEHDAANFRYGDAFGISRSNDLVYIEITVFDTRTVEQKKALFRRIAELLGESPGIRPEDVFVQVAAAAKENWSVGHGLAQFT